MWNSIRFLLSVFRGGDIVERLFVDMTVFFKREDEGDGLLFYRSWSSDLSGDQSFLLGRLKPSSVFYI